MCLQPHAVLAVDDHTRLAAEVSFLPQQQATQQVLAPKSWRLPQQYQLQQSMPQPSPHSSCEEGDRMLGKFYDAVGDLCMALFPDKCSCT